MDSIETISRLTSDSLNAPERRRCLERFAKDNGWRPSDEIEYLPLNHVANAHLVVEHGLKNTVVISFLKGQQAFRNLGYSHQVQLLSLSYNNLIEWHFFPDPEGLTFVNNLVQPLEPKRMSRFDNPKVWRADAFEIVVGRRPNPNIKALDDSLIGMVQYWKRLLYADTPKRLRNENLSALFNSLILIRALEDYSRDHKTMPDNLLPSLWSQMISRKNRTLRGCLRAAFRKIGVPKPAKWLFDEQSLSIFDNLDDSTITSLLRDFYHGQAVPYPYDFSIMSKHSLSRIYEHYVSILREKDSPQLAFFPQLPVEMIDRRLGGIYTPEYIARFFARFLREHIAPRQFRSLSVLDPACGSGILPRTLIEFQSDPWFELNSSSPSVRSFDNSLLLDVDSNACQAARLSLSLLYLVMTGRLPSKKLRILEREAISFHKSTPKLNGSFDVVIANPPFIPWDKIPPNWRTWVGDLMKGIGIGKMDISSAFLKIGMDKLKKGGYLLYVLPHNFLIADAAAGLRNEIHAHFNVLLIADLSRIPVFETVGAYVILLIIQKKNNLAMEQPPAVCMTCKEFAGQALQDALERNLITNDYYSVFEVQQATFAERQWHLYSASQVSLLTKIKAHPPLTQFLEVRQGIVTGADNVFIRKRSEIDDSEMDVYRPLLADRTMERFRTPQRVTDYVFFPYVNGKLVDETSIKENYPLTWAHLLKHKKSLLSRGDSTSRTAIWWKPHRLRDPHTILSPKIVTPHLILLPKFSLDARGKFLVSRSPYIRLLAQDVEPDALNYYLGVLNSSVALWQISSLSHKYGHGYFRLENLTLEAIRVPDPTGIPSSTLGHIDKLVRSLVVNPQDQASISELDHVVCEAYGLTEDEMKYVGHTT